MNKTWLVVVGWCLVVVGGWLTSFGVTMNLEWNVRNDTSVPYEVEINPEKVGGGGKNSWRVFADGKALETMVLPGKAPGTIILRFKVPEGTRKLTSECRRGECLAASKIDNLFAGVLDAANVGKWKLDKGLTATAVEGGILFEDTKVNGRDRYATYTVDLPSEFAGKPAKVAFNVTSKSKLVWGGYLRVRQLDAAGKELPESVSDPRWTSHMRPPEKFTAYREDGVFHPRACKLRLEIGLRSPEHKVDAYGMPLQDKSALLARLLVTLVAVRPAAVLPFPKYDDVHFVQGVTGEEGDAALVMGGKNDGAFWYQTHSQACWAEGYEFRDERDCFFPYGAGTVEAWLKVDWAKVGGDVASIFDWYQGYRAKERLHSDKTICGLAWNRKKRELEFVLRDAAMKEFKLSQKKVTFPSNEWFHFAAVWDPKGGEAKVFVNGREVLKGSLAGFKPFDITNPKVKAPNDVAGMEFFFGCSFGQSRNYRQYAVVPGSSTLQGAVDKLRVSSGCRYAAAFTPEKAIGLDADTRAFFDFDRSFDGKSSGGLGHILGSYRSLTDRVDHKLKVNAVEKTRSAAAPQRDVGKVIQYFPEENLPENDPFKVLDINNYKQMPTAAEYTAARREVQKSFTMKTGESVKYTVPDGAYADYVEVANVGKTTLLYPLAMNAGDLDVRSFGDCAECLNLGSASDREKVNRLFQMVISASDYFMNHNADFAYGSDDPHSVWFDALTLINGYCGFECGPLNNMTANMLSTVAGCPAAQTQGYGHSFEEVFYDGKNHIYDLSAQKFFPAMDNESAACLREVGDQPVIHNRVGQSPDHFMRKGTRGTQAQNPDYRAKVGVTLRPGEAFRVWRGNNGEQNNLQRKAHYKVQIWDLPGYDHKTFAPRYEKETHANALKCPVRRIDRFFPDVSSGFITFSGKPTRGNEAFARVDEDSFCYDVKTGYPITWASYAAIKADGTPAELEISTNLKDFRKLPKPDADGVTRLDYLVRARHGYLIRVKAPIKDIVRFDAVTEVMVNRRTFPGHATPGEHELMLKAVSEGTARVTVQWRENVKDIQIAGGVFSGTIPGYERQSVVLEPSKGLKLAVTGASGEAKAVATKGLTAALSDGMLTISTTEKNPFVGAVTIVDGDASRELTVIACEGARMPLACEGELVGGAKLVEPNAERVQKAAMLNKAGDGVALKFAPVPVGKYLIFCCTRHPGGLVKGESGAMRLAIRLPGGDGKAVVKAGAAANGNCDFLKALYGKRNGRGNWKWDYPFVHESASSSWSGWEIEPEPFDATDRLECRMTADDAKGVEFAACCIIPATVDQDFRGMMKKIFCGLNCQPFRTVAGEQSVPHILVRDFRTVKDGRVVSFNIGTASHCPATLAVLEKHIPGVKLSVWADAPLVPELQRIMDRRFPNVKIYTGPEVPETDADIFLVSSGNGVAKSVQKSIGPWREKTGRPVAAYAIGSAPKPLAETFAFCFYRDKTAFAKAAARKATPAVTGFAPDAVFDFDVADMAGADALLKEFGLEAGKFVCAIPGERATASWDYFGRKPNEKRAALNAEHEHGDNAIVCAAIVEAVRKHGMKALLCAEQRSEMPLITRALLDQLPDDVKANCVCLKDFWAPDLALGVYRRSRCVFGIEMHSQVMAIGNGVPAVVMRHSGFGSKSDMIRDIGLGEWVFDIDEPDASTRAAKVVGDILADENAAREKLRAARRYIDAAASDAVAKAFPGLKN